MRKHEAMVFVFLENVPHVVVKENGCSPDAGCVMAQENVLFAMEKISVITARGKRK